MNVTGGVTFRVFDVRKNPIGTLRKHGSKPEWKIAPPVDHGGHGDDIQILVVDPTAGHVVEVLCDVFNPGDASGTDSVVVKIKDDAPRGQYSFEVYVDGQYVNANSAPGIIVD